MGAAASAKPKTPSDVFEEDDIEENPHRVDVGDQNAVKNMMDDAIVEFFQEHSEFAVHYGWDNTKLLLMVIACAIAGVSHFYRPPHVPEHLIVLACVVAFFVIHGLLFTYATFIEGDILLRVSRKEPSSHVMFVKTEFPFTEENYVSPWWTRKSPSARRARSSTWASSSMRRATSTAIVLLSALRCSWLEWISRRRSE
ncbi:hypothetical protein PINS_up015195 [Pythium insidiosum]|nr:hypothetical protein PINS_up015195 [Pythium insidiosum]